MATMDRDALSVALDVDVVASPEIPSGAKALAKIYVDRWFERPGSTRPLERVPIGRNGRGPFGFGSITRLNLTDDRAMNFETTNFEMGSRITQPS